MLASYLSPSRLGVTGSVEFALHKLWGSCPRRKNKPCLRAVPIGQEDHGTIRHIDDVRMGLSDAVNIRMTLLTSD